MKWLLIVLGVLVGLIALGVVILLILGQRKGGRHMEADIEINRPPAEVWTWITEPDKIKSWVSWTVEVRSVSGDPGAVGSRSIMKMDDKNNKGSRVDIATVVSAANPPHRLDLDLSVPGMFTGKSTYTLTDLGSGRTRLAISSDYDIQALYGRLLMPLIMPQARKKAVSDLAQLKSLAEAAPPPSTAATPPGSTATVK